VFEVILFDVGGVLLTNGWDHQDRAAVLEHFELDRDEFEQRHSSAYPGWDKGEITVDEYLNQTVFHQPRSFRPEAFFLAICERSQKLENGALRILEEVAASNKYLLGSLNNEPRETNEYRFRRFGLGRNLRIRLTSSYLGASKPDSAIYHKAMDILGFPGERILFIDDRLENLEAARSAGLRILHFTGAVKLREDLVELGVL